MWISIIKTNNELSIHGNKFPSFFFSQNASTFYSLNYKNVSANFRKYFLKPCPLTKFGIIAHVLPLTAHCSWLITHVLASLTSNPKFKPWSSRMVSKNRAMQGPHIYVGCDMDVEAMPWYVSSIIHQMGHCGEVWPPHNRSTLCWEYTHQLHGHLAKQPRTHNINVCKGCTSLSSQ